MFLHNRIRIRANRTHRSRPSIEGLESRLCLTVPALSSLPGANHTVYLDFDGFVTQNTVWNSYSFNGTGATNPSINSPAYDTDGNPSVFSSSELADIQDAWARVAEDYRPFQVNVTTVDPGMEALRKFGSGDTQWGVRVVVTRDTEGSRAGGIAYVGSFNWSSDTPAFVYTTGGKYIAEAASHEVGHSLGLAHDGTATSGYYTGHGSGETSWAPLMGVGYYTNVTAWDKGEYYGATNVGSSANYGSGADDLAVITTRNGFGYRPDAVSNTIASATPLATSGTSVSGSGIIERTTDVDVFSFTTGGGPVTLNINPFTQGPNLDIKATLYNSAGAVVAVSNPTGVLSASFSLSLAAGQYFVEVDGTGVGNPGVSPPTGYSEYSSLGSYTINGSVTTSTPLPQLTIGDVSVDEGAGTATFTVSLSGTVLSPVSVGFGTANGTALSGSDYTARAGTLTFNSAGSQTVVVPILDDATTEPSETFFVNLANALNAVILDGQGQATIVDNEVAPTVSITGLDPNLREGTSSVVATVFRFQVNRSGNTSQDLAIPFSVAGQGSNSTNADDFSGKVLPRGTVVFAAGESSKVVEILVNPDSSREANESFRFTLGTVSGVSFLSRTADAVVTNDDIIRLRRSEILDEALHPHKFPMPGAEPEDDDHDHGHDGDHDHDHDHGRETMILVEGSGSSGGSRSVAMGMSSWTDQFVDPAVSSTHVLSILVQDASLADVDSLISQLPASKRIKAATLGRSLVAQGLGSVRDLLN